MATILSIDGKTPRIAPGVYIAPNATIIGDVVIEEGASVWFGCVLRADIGSIRIGKRSNIQDLTCIHMTDGLSNTEVGDDVTVGHRVVLHGCTVGNGALIGMGSVVMDNADIGAESLVAAGSLVSPRTIVPPGSLLRGSPGKVIRPVTEEERLMGQLGAAHYVENAKRYLAAMEAGAR
jgi:carbonic anhydrase/acetyltransferase-like protein (isoleucine patch superfamily)